MCVCLSVCLSVVLILTRAGYRQLLQWRVHRLQWGACSSSHGHKLLPLYQSVCNTCLSVCVCLSVCLSVVLILTRAGYRQLLPWRVHRLQWRACSSSHDHKLLPLYQSVCNTCLSVCVCLSVCLSVVLLLTRAGYRQLLPWRVHRLQWGACSSSHGHKLLPLYQSVCNTCLSVCVCVSVCLSVVLILTRAGYRQLLPWRVHRLQWGACSSSQHQMTSGCW